MVESLGIDVYKIFMLVFGIGAMAAGFAGIVQCAGRLDLAGRRRIDPRSGVRVVVIGGVGSFPGAVLGGLIAARSSASRRCSTLVTRM